MIDYVHLIYNVKIDTRKLNAQMWYRAFTDEQEEVFVHEMRGVKIRYYPERERILLEGKLLMLLHDTQVLNVDDLYGRDTERFVGEINLYFKRILPFCELDIRAFRVKRIDYCFNVKTEYVDAYISFLNTAFNAANGNSRKNYAKERKVRGSVYAKTNSDFRENERRNYVLNFYDKADRLKKKRAANKRVAESDFEAAKNVLRLEVQCGYRLIDEICEQWRITDTFGNLFSFSVAFAVIERVYSRVFGGGVEQDFFAYEAAKAMISRRQEKVRQTLFSAATNHSIRGQKYAYARQQIKNAAIYPYCFLPKSSGLERLDNPLKLIRKKLEQMDVVI